MVPVATVLQVRSADALRTSLTPRPFRARSASIQRPSPPGAVAALAVTHTEDAVRQLEEENATLEMQLRSILLHG